MQKEINNKKCPCPKTDCDNYNDCVACNKKHATVGGLPFCKRPIEIKSCSQKN
ncbi:MAG: hypothetical protein FWC11_05830 [Firmicutes bacterium]|nr:hypothetical protein [Bacillota bacterium]